MIVIKTAFTSKFRNAEIIQFAEDILSLVKKREPIHKQLMGRYTNLSQAYDEAAAAYDPIKKLLNTKGLIQLDKKRDALTIGLRATLVGLTKHPDTNMSTAAEKLLDTMDSYGSAIYRFNYQLQTRITKDLLAAIKEDTDLDTAVDTLLVIRAFITSLTTSNDQFNEVFLVRSQEKGEKTTAEMKTLVEALEAAYRNFIKRLNSIVDMDDEGVFDTAIVNDINAVIDQYNQVVSNRSEIKNTDSNEEGMISDIETIEA